MPRILALAALSLRRLLLPGVVLSLVACQQPTEVPTELEPSFMVGSLAQAASGSWTIPDPDAHAIGRRTFAFTARRYADGTVTGVWERVNQSLDIRANGIVTCMTIIGNQVWVGTLTKTGPQAGTEGWFTAIDNGEGAAAAPDRVSLQRVDAPPGASQLYCEDATATPNNDVGAGQVQVGTVMPTPPGPACDGQIVQGIAQTWPWAHDGQMAFPPPPGSIALWLEIFGPAIGIDTVRELQLLFCGP